MRCSTLRVDGGGSRPAALDVAERTELRLIEPNETVDATLQPLVDEGRAALDRLGAEVPGTDD